MKERVDANYFVELSYSGGPTVVVAPAEDEIEVREILRRDDDMGTTVFRIRRDVHGATNTVFWIEPARYRRIADEIVERLDRPSSHAEGRSTRLSALEGTELRTLLVERLPLVHLSACARSIPYLP